MTVLPRVSICVPTRNHGQFLAEAISSALDQDIEDLEVLVHDDASVDDTRDVVHSFGDPRLRYLRHPAAVGVAANRNSCLAAARGQYIVWLDSDDQRVARTLGRQLPVLDAHPQVTVVHGGRTVIDADGRELPDWPAPFGTDTIESSAVAFGHLIAANELTTSTVVVRRCAHELAGPFDETIGTSSSDWEMWLRLALRGAVAHVAERVARYRQHADSISHASSASGERLRCNLRVVERVLCRERDLIPEPERAASTAYAAVAAQALLHAGDAYTRGAHDEALEAIELAGRAAPDVRTEALLAATARRDDVACMRLTRAALGVLAHDLEGTRFGTKIAEASRTDARWDRQLSRTGATVARVTPEDAVIAAIAKWDPTVIEASGRAGLNYPERRLHPDGYPRDGTSAVAHLDALCVRRGVTHLVVPSFSGWWLDHYPELAQRLGVPLWEDRDCAIYEVAPL